MCGGCVTSVKVIMMCRLIKLRTHSCPAQSSTAARLTEQGNEVSARVEKLMARLQELERDYEARKVEGGDEGRPPPLPTQSRTVTLFLCYPMLYLGCQALREMTRVCTGDVRVEAADVAWASKVKE